MPGVEACCEKVHGSDTRVGNLHGSKWVVDRMGIDNKANWPVVWFFSETTKSPVSDGTRLPSD